MPKHGSINLYVHGNHWEGSLGRTAQDDVHLEWLFCHSSWTKTGGGGRGRSYTHRYTVTTTRMIRWAAMRAILIVRDKATTGQRPCPQTTTFEEKGEPKQYQTEVLTTHQPTALPLGQTGSQKKLWTVAKNTAQRVTIFTAVRIRKPPTTIRRAAVPIRIHGPLFAQPRCQ